MMGKTVPLTGAGGGASDPYAGYLVYDTFTDDDETAISDHTPEKGGPWTQVGGDTILTNRCWYSNIGGGSYIFAGAAGMDVTWNLDNTDLSPGQPGARFRGSADGATYLVLRVIAGSLLYLDDDALNNLGSAGITLTDTSVLRVVVNGNDIDVYWDGVLKIEVTSAYGAGGTGVGFWSWGGLQAVTTLAATAV